MTPDDSESTGDEPTEAPSPVSRASRAAPEPALPARVATALDAARAAAKADRERRSGRWLSVIPVASAAILLFLLMPRAAAPDGVPIPRVDERVLAEIARTDDNRAHAAEAQRLPSDVLSVGSAIRAFNATETRHGDEIEKIDARRQLDGALSAVAPRAGIEDDLLSLRALQTRRFLDALARWDATGERSEDFSELAGAFVDRAADAGWVADGHLLMSDADRRVAFKTVWNAVVGVETKSRFALSLDEQRSIYAFYIQHPHPADSRRPALEAQRKAATTADECSRANIEIRRQTELWRADKIRKLGAIDPTYPAAYALGVSYYLADRYELSAESFTAFIATHPDGPYSLRARNHLKAALSAGGAL